MKLPISYLQPGMKLGRSIYGPKGEVLLNTGITLTDYYIKALKRHKIMGVYIEDSLTDEVLEAENALEDEVRYEAMSAVRSWADSSSKKNTIAAYTTIEHSVKNIVEEIISGKTSIGGLTEISAVDTYTFAHSVDVCVLSITTGIKFGYSKDNLIKLGIGSLLHDLGKVKITPEILHKPAKLTEEEYSEIQKHPVWSYTLLKEKGEDLINPHSLVIALNHHERFDGSGYPRGLKGDQIHDMAAICAIADVYNAMTTDRVYREAIPPHEVYEMLMGSGDILFNYKVVTTFLSCVVPYPSGSYVYLNTGEIACVISTNLNYPFQPTVKRVSDSMIFDLQKTNLAISGLVPPQEKLKMIFENNKTI